MPGPSYLSRVSTHLSGLVDTLEMSLHDVERYEAKCFFLPGRMIKIKPQLLPGDPDYLINANRDRDGSDEDAIDAAMFGYTVNVNSRESFFSAEDAKIHPEIAKICQIERQILKFHSLEEHNKRYTALESEFNRLNGLMAPLRTHPNNSRPFKPLYDKILRTYQHRKKDRKVIANFEDWVIGETDALSDKEIDGLQRKIQNTLHNAINPMRKLPADCDRTLEFALAALVERRKLKAKLEPILHKGPESLRRIAKTMEGKMINEESHLRMGICEIPSLKAHSLEKLKQDVRDLTEIFRMIKAARGDYKEWERMRFRKTYQSDKPAPGERLEPIEEKRRRKIFSSSQRKWLKMGLLGNCGHVEITERD